jgi:PAS domain S-box-containing protein
MIDLHQGEIFRPVEITPEEVLAPTHKKTNHRSILDHSPDIIMRIGADGCLLYANPRSEEILGTKPEFLIGKNCREIGLPEAMCDFWKKLIASTINGRTPTSREFTIQTPHGARHYEVRACPESEDTVEAQSIIATVRDMTRHRICESGLAEAGQRLLYHMNNSPLAVIEFDSDGHCLSWNHKAEEFFGPPKFRDGQPLTGPMPLVYPEDRERFQEAYESVANCTQMSGFVTTRFIHRNGNVSQGEWYLSGLVDENVTCRSILCFLNDVSVRDKAEQALLRSKEDLEEMVVSRTTTLRRINEDLGNEISTRKHLERELVKVSEREHRRLGHDLHDGICQELAGIFYSIQAIAKRLGKSSPVQTSLHAIVQAVQRSIHHTRLLSRGLAPIELENGELPTALEQLVADTASLFEVDCEFECPEPSTKFSPEVSSNLFRITQEAIQNAIKHGHATRIRVALHFKKREGMLTITDNGSGIENKNSVKGEGNGMGLTIMRHRAALIHGSVSINSHNGSGTSVHCVFKK